jgi:hypothetical protein
LSRSLFQLNRRVKCPAEENANLERLLHINARKNCGKTDIKANKVFPALKVKSTHIRVVKE